MSAISAEIIQFVPNNKNQSDERPVLVKPGLYEVTLVKTWKGFLHGRAPKLILVFRILDEGPYYGRHLYRAYNVRGFTDRKEIIPKGWHSDFVREYARLFGVPHKLRDIGVRQYKSKVFSCRVRTVERDYKQRPLPEGMQYSIIDEILKVDVG